MFVMLQYGGEHGHTGVLLTGLGPKSCFLHYTGSSYLKGLFARRHHVGNFGGRVLIPSQEDGNPDGVSETWALRCWQYYKHVLYNNHTQKWETEGRGKVFDDKYNNLTRNCTLFCDDLLTAATQGESNSGLLNAKSMFTHKIPIPGRLMGKAKDVRDEVLHRIIKKRKAKPIYGYVLEIWRLTKRSSEKDYLEDWPLYRPEDNVDNSNWEYDDPKDWNLSGCTIKEMSLRESAFLTKPDVGPPSNPDLLQHLTELIDEANSDGKKKSNAPRLHLVSRAEGEEAKQPPGSIKNDHTADFQKLKAWGVHPLRED